MSGGFSRSKGRGMVFSSSLGRARNSGASRRAGMPLATGLLTAAQPVASRLSKHAAVASRGDGAGCGRRPCCESMEALPMTTFPFGRPIVEVARVAVLEAVDVVDRAGQRRVVGRGLLPGVVGHVVQTLAHDALVLG